MRATDVDGPLLLGLLIERGVIEEKSLRELAKAQPRHASLEAALVRTGLATEEAIAEAYAAYLSVPLIGPGDGVLEGCRKVAHLVPETVCRKRHVVPISVHDDVLDLACLNPSDLQAVDEVQLFSGCVVRPHAAPLSLVEEITRALFGAHDMVREISSEENAAALRAIADADQAAVLDLDRAVPPGKEGQVIRIVNFVLKNAIRAEASDIHLEPYEETVRIRYRIDGHLVEKTPPSKSLFVPVLSRLKVLSKMDIAERRIPQDGAIAVRTGDARVDLRVSTVPTVYGEKMVLRILAKEATPESLQALGFSHEQEAAFREAAAAPHGLIFVTGPTGSGKSTTLYTCLNLINEASRNIVTVEDPVEYRFEGLNQCHVRSNVGLTFAAALRAFLRQDPDVIMVGEVRDQETAQICLRAALTGHLVLSTLHTNDSLQAVNRLLDMGIEPFLLGPALRLVEAQRLARKLCSACKEPYDIAATTAATFGVAPGATLYRAGQGACETCHGIGYKGRVGIFEVIRITEGVCDLILARAPAPELRAAASRQGSVFLSDSARAKVVAGVTSIEEVADYLRAPGDDR